MSTQRVLFAALIAAAVSAPAFAEEKKPASAPPTGSSVTAGKPATTGTASVTAKLNLNTATAGQLEKLPKITPTEAKAIMSARGKAKFKDWDDFVTRKVISADAAAAIKDSVTF